MIFERSTESCAPFFSAQNKKVRTNKHNNKSFVHLFKGGGVEGWSPSSPSAEGESPLYFKRTEQGVRNAKAFRGEAC